jgi:hypothetical protein
MKEKKDIRIIVEKFVRDCDETHKITAWESFEDLKKFSGKGKYFIFRGMFFALTKDAIYVYVKKDINKEHPLSKNYKWLR